MDLTPAEKFIMELLRGEPAVDFAMNVAWLGPTWTVSITSESDGLLAGHGGTFRQALHSAFNVETDPDGGERAEPTKLRLVGGTAS